MAKKKLSRAQQFKKIMNMARYHKEVVVVFNEPGYNYDRRRKVRSNGKCFVSYLGYDSKQWSRYSQSCFTCDDHKPASLKRTIKLMRDHDGKWLNPVAILVGKKRIDL